MLITKSTGAKEAVGPKKSVITSDMAAFGILFIGTALLPLIILPFLNLAPDVGKKFFVFGLLIVVAALWIVGRLQAGEVQIPRSVIVLALPLLPLSFLVAGFFSDSIRYSLIGPLYLSGTMLAIFAMVILSLLVMIMFDNRKKIFNFFLAIMLVAVVGAIYHLAVILLGGTVLPSLLNFLPQSLLGKWHELSVFFGFTTILSLLMLELPVVEDSQSRPLRWLSIATLVLSVLMLVITNFTVVWLAVGLVALLVFVYSMAARGKSESAGNGSVGLSSPESKKVIRASFFILLAALLFLILGRQGGLIDENIHALYNRLGISFVEVRPSWVSTGTVAKGVLISDPLTGVGPGNFDSAWSLYKPRLVNEMQYWNIGFSNAVGIIPTFAITTGLLGVLAWLALVLAIFYTAWQASQRIPTDPLTRFLVVSSFTGMIYFWGMSILYTPEAVGFPYLFIMTAVFVATLATSKTIPLITFRFYDNPRNYFISLLVLVLLLIVVIAGGYLFVQRLWSVAVYQRGNIALNMGDIETANREIIKAINLNSYDPLYFRTLSNVKIQELSKLLSSTNIDIEEARPLLQDILATAVAASLQAVSLNPTDNANIMSRGNVYEYLAGLGVDGAYDQALATYKEAVETNPNNPEILLALARVEINAGKFESARDYLERALTVKSNFSSSILLLAQLDTESAGAPAAIRRLETAVQSITNDPSLYFQLGFLRYRAGDFSGSVSAMQRVVALSPGGLNANASYFLGLSYAALNETARAIEQFEIIANFNPDNTEIKQIINNLRAGRDPLFGLTSDLPKAPATEDEEDEGLVAEPIEN